MIDILIPHEPDAISYRCMEHSIHVATGHFIKAIGPTSSRNVIRKVKKAFKNAGVDDSNLDVKQLGIELDEVGDREDDRDDGDGNDSVEFDVGDTVGNALALVTQAGSLFISFETLLNYKMVLTDPKVTTSMRIFSTSLRASKLELKLWIRTRWASLYDFLDHMIMLRLVRLFSPSLMMTLIV